MAVVGPLLTDHGPNEYVGPPAQRPSADWWFGTTMFGQDVFAQFAHGLRSTFLGGAAGRRAGGRRRHADRLHRRLLGRAVDEVLNMVTNVVPSSPPWRCRSSSPPTCGSGVVPEAVFIGLFSWPWVARAIRAQAFPPRSREFVDLARLSGSGGVRIVVAEIALNMSSYLFMTFILLFGGRS